MIKKLFVNLCLVLGLGWGSLSIAEPGDRADTTGVLPSTATALDTTILYKNTQDYDGFTGSTTAGDELELVVPMAVKNMYEHPRLFVRITKSIYDFHVGTAGWIDIRDTSWAPYESLLVFSSTRAQLLSLFSLASELSDFNLESKGRRLFTARYQARATTSADARSTATNAAYSDARSQCHTACGSSNCVNPQTRLLSNNYDGFSWTAIAEATAVGYHCD